MPSTATRLAESAAPPRRAADRSLLLERVAIGLAHEGKNPLHNMVLHLQLLQEKMGAAEGQGAPVARHLQAVRDGIGKVDALLKAFGDFAAPHGAGDLGAAVQRAALLFSYDARRSGVELRWEGAGTAAVEASAATVGDAVAHALIAALELARDGGTVDVDVSTRPGRAVAALRATGGVGRRAAAEPYLAALRLLAGEGPIELSIDIPPAGGGRLSLAFAQPR